MGHIQDRGQDGGRKRWRARIRSPSGRERSKSFDRKIDARRWLTEQEHRRDVGQWVDPAAGRRHFGKWLDEWLDSRRRQVRPSTYARDESYCRNHLRPEFGDVPLSAISQPHVVAWVGELDEDKDLAAATVKKAYTLLSQVLQAAVDAGLLPTSPCSNVPLPRDEPAEMRFLSPGEVARLADVADPRYRAMVLLAAYGGLRLGELTGLRRRCYDTRAGQVKIVETLTWVRGDPYFGPRRPPRAAGGSPSRRPSARS